MDGIGPEPKRQRLEHNGPRALPPQPAISQPYSHPGTLPTPQHTTYPPPHQPPPPPSPYDLGPHEQRSLPDPTPHAYVQEHSGHNTPVRERGFHQDPYSRRSSASATAPLRSPDGPHQYPPPRSMSTALPAEGQHYAPPSHQYPSEPGGHLPGYPTQETPPNGTVHHGLPIHTYPQHPYPPHEHQIDYNHPPAANGPPSYGSVNYGNPFSQGASRPLKKGNRATQACDVCRQRKAKCDEGRPECSFCTENGMKCNYQNVAPAKADRANQQIIDQLSSYKVDIQELKEDWGGRLERIEQLLQSFGTERGIPSDHADVKPPLARGDSPKPRPNAEYNMLSGNPTGKDQATINPSPSTSFVTAGTDSSGGDAVATQSNAIYIEHDTAAQKLFRWRSIKALLRKSRDLDWSDRFEEYVMNEEMNKGVLRIYGRGRQMRDVGYSSDTGTNATSPAPSSHSGPSDEASTAGSPASSPENLWGTGFVPTLAETKQTSDVGGLGPDNTLKLDPRTISRLFKSYLDNMHILHPFLKEGELTRQIENFKQRYNPHDSATMKAVFGVPAVDNLRDPYARAPKRKHSDGQFYSPLGESNLAPSPLSPKILLERSPETAKILLVLALGKICEVREPLPGPVPDNPRDGSTSTSRSYPPLRGPTDSPPPSSYPMRQSPSSSSQTTSHSTADTSAPSPAGLGRMAASSPRSANEPLPTRNVDQIPGLAYYAHATDILGNLLGYHELITAQCCLLAGLYAGQLANALENLTWVQHASRICRFLVKEPSFNKVKEPKKEFIKLAFWTSLQLESDILAELDVPPSGIQEVQDEIQYPKGTVDQAEANNAESNRSEVMIYYSFQLHIRKLLNDIQKELYQEKDANFKRATKSTSLRNAFDAMITDWRRQLPEKLQWEDSNHIANNINDARLRGKFYGAQYIIHRPFLHAALDFDFEEPEYTLSSPKDGNFQQEMGPPRSMTDQERRKQETIDLAVTCINAAVRSTTAFDGVLEHRRMVVTNIMGTAHAQFGNMLVLSAAFKSKTLGKFIQDENLGHLFDRTIRLLRLLAPISSTLAKDCHILQCLRKVVFNKPGNSHLASSFSSE